MNGQTLVHRLFTDSVIGVGSVLRWKSTNELPQQAEIDELLSLAYITSGVHHLTSLAIADRDGHFWRPDEIFVFGSNLRGAHAGGAADFAKTKCGAVEGVAEGLTGQSYALPTCSEPGIPLKLGEIFAAQWRFQEFACRNPQLKFFLTRVGCGIAGFTDEQIGPWFRYAPSNVRKPIEWRNI